MWVTFANSLEIMQGEYEWELMAITVQFLELVHDLGARVVELIPGNWQNVPWVVPPTSGWIDSLPASSNFIPGTVTGR